MQQEPIPNTVIRYEFDATLTLLMQQKMPSKILPAIFHCIRSLHKNMIAAENGGELDRDKVIADLTWAIEHLLAIRHSIVEMFGAGPRRATTQDKFIALRSALRRLLVSVHEEIVPSAKMARLNRGCRWTAAISSSGTASFTSSCGATIGEHIFAMAGRSIFGGNFFVCHECKSAVQQIEMVVE